MLDVPVGLERIALRVAQAYHDRWQIETSFQTVKQEFVLEKARVRTFRWLENLFARCILAYVFVTDHLRKARGFAKVLKLLADNLETVSAKTHVLLAGIRALVAESKIRFISGRPQKCPPGEPVATGTGVLNGGQGAAKVKTAFGEANALRVCTLLPCKGPEMPPNELSGVAWRGKPTLWKKSRPLPQACKK